MLVLDRVDRPPIHFSVRTATVALLRNFHLTLGKLFDFAAEKLPSRGHCSKKGCFTDTPASEKGVPIVFSAQTFWHFVQIIYYAYA